MTLQQLHYVLVIAEAGSLNRAAEQLYLLYAVARAHELCHAPAVGFKRFCFGECVRREGREVVASPAVEVAVVGKMEVEYRYHVPAPHVLACPLCHERKQFAPHEHQSVGHHSF